MYIVYMKMYVCNLHIYTHIITYIYRERERVGENQPL